MEEQQQPHPAPGTVAAQQSGIVTVAIIRRPAAAATTALRPLACMPCPGSPQPLLIILLGWVQPRLPVLVMEIHLAKLHVQVFDLGKELGYEMDVLDLGGGFTGGSLQNVRDVINTTLDECFPADGKGEGRHSWPWGRPPVLHKSGVSR